jgi:hypothetical protein
MVINQNDGTKPKQMYSFGQQEENLKKLNEHQKAFKDVFVEPIVSKHGRELEELNQRFKNELTFIPKKYE